MTEKRSYWLFECDQYDGMSFEEKRLGYGFDSVEAAQDCYAAGGHDRRLGDFDSDRRDIADIVTIVAGYLVSICSVYYHVRPTTGDLVQPIWGWRWWRNKNGELLDEPMLVEHGEYDLERPRRDTTVYGGMSSEGCVIDATLANEQTLTVEP